jgi:hypothetical protein
MDTEAVTLRPERPAIGATGVPLKPVFQWTAVIGATAYELLVATNVNMDNPVISRTGEDAITGNAWQCDISLDYATTYYWKVRAINASTSSAWSTTGVFTTEEAPPPEETPTPTPEGVVAEIMLPPANTTPAQVESPPTPTLAVNIITVPDLGATPDAFFGMPEWAIYLIGGLLGTVILALIVVLVMVIKLKRTM